MAEPSTQILAEPPILPPPDFQARARISSLDAYQQLYRRALEDPEGFWREQAQVLDWFETPQRILEWDPPFARWFVGGTLNVSYNCLDRHLAFAGTKRRCCGKPNRVRFAGLAIGSCTSLPAGWRICCGSSACVPATRWPCTCR